MNLLKYVGSKDQLLPVIGKYIPDNIDTIIEPFCGSASVSLSQDKSYYLADSSPELINFLECVRDCPVATIVAIKNINDKYLSLDDSLKKDFYMKLRSEDRKDGFSLNNTRLRAARYYFIIYHCFNGMYRVNQKGQCNTPFGGNVRKLPKDWEDRIRLSSEHMVENCKGILYQQFDDTGYIQSLIDSTEDVSKLFVFIDPPYHDTFDMYTKEGTRFDFWDRLLNYLEDLDKAGIAFLMTNSYNDFILNKFSKFKVDKVPVMYTISANGNRPTVFESFITNK